MVQETGASIKDIEVVISCKLDQGIASLLSLLTCSSGEGDLCLLMARALRGETVVDMGIEVTHNQGRGTW